jgi:hypothetical protein
VKAGQSTVGNRQAATEKKEKQQIGWHHLNQARKEIKKGGKENKKIETLLAVSNEVADFVRLDPWHARICFYLFWVMCFVCYQNSVCVCGYIQPIWTLSVQEYVLSVLGDLLICFETAFW